MLVLVSWYLIIRIMELFTKATQILRSNSFDRRRVLAVKELHRRASGEEREMIGSLFESQYALADEQDDLDWLDSLA